MVHDGVSAKGTTLPEHHTVPEKESTQPTIYVSEILEGSLLPEVDGNAQNSMGGSTGGGVPPQYFRRLTLMGAAWKESTWNGPRLPQLSRRGAGLAEKTASKRGKNVVDWSLKVRRNCYLRWRANPSRNSYKKYVRR